MNWIARPHTRWMPRNNAIDLVTSKRVDVASWVTHRVPLAKAQKVFDMVEAYSGGVLKAVVLP